MKKYAFALLMGALTIIVCDIMAIIFDTSPAGMLGAATIMQLWTMRALDDR